MNVALSKGFWKELCIEPEETIDQNIALFYEKYSREISISLRTKDKKKASGLLKLKAVEGGNLFLDIFLNHLERQIKSPKMSSIELSRFRIEEDSLKRYSNRLIRRLRKIESIPGVPKNKLYCIPQFYPNPFIEESSKKIRFVIKKYSGKAIKKGRRKSIYPGYIEKLIILTKKEDSWLLRHSFSNRREKEIIKNIFSSQKIVLSKELKMEDLIEKLLNKTNIQYIEGEAIKGEHEYKYNLSALSPVLNNVIAEDLSFLFKNPQIIDKIGGIKFCIGDKKIEYKITPYIRLNTKHLKLVTTGLSPYQILEISKVLSHNLGLSEEIILTRPEDRHIRLKYVLNANKIKDLILSSLYKEIEYLHKLRLISVRYMAPFYTCLNEDCVSFEHIFKKVPKKECINCKKHLTRYGEEVIISRNNKAIEKIFKKVMAKEGYGYKEVIIKQVNKTRYSLLKFSNKNKQEVLAYITHSGESLQKLAQRFSERALPILFITPKNEIQSDNSLNAFCAGKIDFPEIFIKYEKKEDINLAPVMERALLKIKEWKINYLGSSLITINEFLNSHFNLEKIEGKSIQHKGRVFERLTTHILKGIAQNWIELGQIYQNKSVPDGVGFVSDNKKRFVFGFDAKLKGNSKYSKGLSKKEIENQTKYILELKSKARKYGGLKSWLIVIKSERDYPKFERTIEKLKSKSHFKNILLLGLEPLIKLCDIYRELTGEDILNKDIFYEFLYKLLKYKGDITIKKVEQIHRSIENKIQKITPISIV